jgi:hypothetical protein
MNHTQLLLFQIGWKANERRFIPQTKNLAGGKYPPIGL